MELPEFRVVPAFFADGDQYAQVREVEYTDDGRMIVRTAEAVLAEGPSGDFIVEVVQATVVRWKP